MYPARNSLYVGTHPVFVSHTKEIEQLLYFVSDLQERLRNKGTITGSEGSGVPVGHPAQPEATRTSQPKQAERPLQGSSAPIEDADVRYDCLGRVRRKCSDLLLKLYAEETNIMLMDDLDHRWVVLIVSFVKNTLLKDPPKAF